MNATRRVRVTRIDRIWSVRLDGELVATGPFVYTLRIALELVDHFENATPRFGTALEFECPGHNLGYADPGKYVGFVIDVPERDPEVVETFDLPSTSILGTEPRVSLTLSAFETRATEDLVRRILRGREVAK